jgi:hypothetical protein
MFEIDKLEPIYKRYTSNLFICFMHDLGLEGLSHAPHDSSPRSSRSRHSHNKQTNKVELHQQASTLVNCGCPLTDGEPSTVVL